MDLCNLLWCDGKQLSVACQKSPIRMIPSNARHHTNPDTFAETFYSIPHREPKIAIIHIQNKLDSITPGQEIIIYVWSSCPMCLTSPSSYSTPALLSYNWTFWTQGSQNSRRSLLFVNIVNTLRSSWTDWIASSLSFSLPLKWEMGLNSYSCKCRNPSSLSQDLLPFSPPLLFHPGM